MKDGLILSFRAGWIDMCPTPGDAELLGVLAGVEIARQLRLR